MILPITILNFHTISFTFFISNILASFLIGIITIGGFVFVILSILSASIGELLSIFIKIPLKGLIAIAKYSSQIPFSKIYVTTPSFFIFILYILILFFPVFLTKIKTTRKFIYRKIKEKREKIKAKRKTIFLFSIFMKIF